MTEMTWQPIETAPKDGTLVDLWIAECDGSARRVTFAWWVENEPADQFDYNGIGARTSGWWARNQWYDNEDGWLWREGEEYNRPTHWMPLPAPPKAGRP